MLEIKHEHMMASKDEEYQHALKTLKNENSLLMVQLNAEMDKCLKIGEGMDAKQEQINQMEKELQRKCDEVNLRKEVIDSMSASLMSHENDQRELASKLVMMKNQIMENDIGKSIGRRFAAVREGGVMKTMTPVSVRQTIYWKF